MMTKTSHDQLEPPFRLSFPRRLLLQTATTGAVSPDPSALALDSDVVLILAALLCALICVVGLALAARCAWLRRAVVAATQPAGAGASSAPNKGLKKKAIRALPKLAFSPAHRATLPFSDCPICLADFAEGEEVRVLPRCAHAFHATCIDTWLASHSSCPSCRQNLAAATRTKAAAAVPAGHPEEAVSAAAAGAAGSCAATGAASSGGAGRCLWCGAASSVVDADGGEQGAKGREDGNSSQYLP